jgi:hypothetical protein
MSRRERIERTIELFRDSCTPVLPHSQDDIITELRALWAVVDAARAWDENADNLSHDVIERVLTDALDAYHREDLQMQVAQYLDLRGWLWNHTANERKTTIRAGGRLKKKGVKPGVPDVMIYESWCGEWPDDDDFSGPPRGFGVAIELKVGRNKPTEAQNGWLDALAARGWSTHVCRSLDGVIEACKVIG